jgi:hypothetical protein
MHLYQIEISDQEIEIIKNFIKEHGISYKNLYLSLALSHLKPREDGRWGEKYAGFGAESKYFLDLFPKGQVIAITRNLTDAYISNREKVKRDIPAAYERGDHLLILDDWKRFTKNWHEFIKNRESNSYLHITYEELLTSPIDITKKICNFLQLEWNNDMIDPSKFIYEDGTTWYPNTSFDDKIIGLDKSNIGRHRKEILDDEIELVEFFEKAYSMEQEFVVPIEYPQSNLQVQKLESVITHWKDNRNY